MKILNINKFYYLRGGAERYYFDLTQLLESHGHTVIPFAMHHPKNLPTPWSRFFVREKNYRNGASLIEKLRAARDILWNFEAAAQLDTLLREVRPDIAHIHNIAHQLSPSIIHVLRRHKIPMVQTLHDYKLISSDYLLFPRTQPWTEKMVLSIERILHRFVRSYALVDHFIAPTKFMKDMCVYRGILKQKISHITYPVSISYDRHCDPPAGGEAISGAPGIASSPPSANPRNDQEYFLFVGRLVPEKGLCVLLEAMRQLSELRLVVVGDGPGTHIHDREKVSHNIDFLGHQDPEQVRRLMAGAMALVVPSLWYETPGIVILEAFAQGVPVIASNIGAIPEVVQDGTNGILVPPGDVSALSVAMKRMAALPQEQRQAMGAAGYAYVASQHRSEAHYRQVMLLYATITKR